MSARDSNGWAGLENEDLQSLDAADFEDFCFDLIRCEAYDRHDDPLLFGPSGKSVPDGGSDILLEVRRPPRDTRQDYQRRHQLGPLTEDHLGRTVYSCKSGKGWFDDALDDIQRARKEPDRAVLVLLEGGHVKLLVRATGKLDAPVKRGGVSRAPRAHLARAFLERMREIDPQAEDPADRVQILDAHSITGFLRARAPAGGPMERWLTRLDLVPLLHGLDEWRRVHVEDRSEPAFVDDAFRARLRASLLAFLHGALPGVTDLSCWLVGPPGVGKSRLMIDALNRDAVLAQRVRVAFGAEEAFAALRTGRLLTRHPDVVLIVDDCPVVDVGQLGAEFRALVAKSRSATQPSSTPRLLLMTPASRDTFSSGRLEPRWFLEPLDEPSALELAEHAVGAPAQTDERVHGVVRLSEGYPWFVTLLAREAILEQRAPQNIREAVQWALASRRERVSGDELRALQLRRARCLLAASLTPRIDWAELSPDTQAEVARAVGLPRWQEVVDTASECVDRGILRRNLGWKFKYVTPHIVEREVIAWLLAPDGPDPGGRTLRRHGAAFLSDFFETLERLDLPSDVLSAIARGALSELQSLPRDRGSLSTARMLGSPLRFVVRHEPEAAARELHRRIAELDVPELRSRRDERRALVLAFEELAARRGTFDLAEDALFRLALAENESFGNNATAVWSELFFPELNMSYRSIAGRMSALEGRLTDPEPAARILALGGARAALTTHAARRSIDALDGPRPETAPSEAMDARMKVWRALVQRFRDPEPDVASQAKKVAFGEVRSAIRWGIGEAVLALLADHAESLDDVDRVALRRALLSVRTYDDRFLSTARAALEGLERRLLPGSFRERLHQHVGTFGPARLRKNDEAADDMLAREGVAGAAPIVVELDWLVSAAAVRAHVFAFALGRQDEHGVLLSPLRARARDPGAGWMAKVVLARYLGGWREAGRADAAAPVLREMAAAPEESESVALSVVELGASEERLGWIEAALQANRLGAPCLTELARRQHWLSAIGDDRFHRFCAVLLEDATAARAAAALELLVDRARERPGSVLLLKDLLHGAMDRLAVEPRNGMTDLFWELGAEILVARGETTRVAELSVRALSHAESASEHAWNALHTTVKREPSAAFRAVTRALSRHDAASGHLLLAFMFHRSSFEWPPDEVMSWVGHDERRGRTMVALVPRDAAELDPILRMLIQRFGAHGSVANEVIARMHSTNGLVPSLAEHDARHLERARKWLNDADPEVRAFADRLVRSLETSHAHHAAEEEDERRRWGT